MPKRRTLLLITEGTSDANALAAPLQKLLNEVRLGDFKSDATSPRRVSFRTISKESTISIRDGTSVRRWMDLSTNTWHSKDGKRRAWDGSRI